MIIPIIARSADWACQRIIQIHSMSMNVLRSTTRLLTQILLQCVSTKQVNLCQDNCD